MSRYMKGHVESVSPSGDRVSLLLEDGDRVVFDMDSAREVELQDVISGVARSYGSQTVRNETQRRDLRIYVEAYGATLQNAATLLAQRK